MSLWSIDIAQLVRDLTPRTRRSTEQNALGSGLLSGVGRSAKILQEYRQGTAAPAWSAGTYAKYDQVVYNYAVYESLEDGNTATPDDASKWGKILNLFIGVEDAQLYNGGKINLEYALNTYFGTTFSNTPGASDIYIQNNATPDFTFIAGLLEADSSAVGLSGSTEYIPLTYTAAAPVALFTIWVPVAVHTALGTDADGIIRNFADRYVVAGITYDIDTY